MRNLTATGVVRNRSSVKIFSESIVLYVFSGFLQIALIIRFSSDCSNNLVGCEE